MNQRIALCVLLMAIGCDAGSDRPEDKAHDSGARDEPHNRGDRDPCVNAEPLAIAWDEESPIGSPAAVFGQSERSCEAELSWDGAQFDDRAIEPRDGTSAVTVVLHLDHGSARWIDREGRDGFPDCSGGFLTVDGSVALATADGTFRTESAVTLAHSDEDPTLTYQVSQPLAEHDGSLAVELQDGESGSLRYELDGSGTACAGSITLTIGTSRGGLGMLGGGELASWSDSACPLGEAPFDATDLAHAIEAEWGDASYTGTWQGGERTELSLQVVVASTDACRSLDAPGEVFVPVRATYSTSDGRLRARTADGSVRAVLDSDGDARALHFWLSDDQVCEDARAALDYTPADCAEVERVTVQLGINRTSDGAIDFRDEGLTVYPAARDDREQSTDHLALPRQKP